jgi:Cytochrome bd terminal oxidase subunit I
VTHTERGAGLNVGGIPVPGHPAGIVNVKIPDLLSLLAFDQPIATVRGLDSFPKADRPPLAGPVRLAFIGMVGIGTGLVALSLWYWLRRRRNGPEDRFTCWRSRRRGHLRSWRTSSGGWSASSGGNPGPSMASSDLERDHHGSWVGCHFHGLHDALPRPRWADDLERAAADIRAGGRPARTDAEGRVK